MNTDLNLLCKNLFVNGWTLRCKINCCFEPKKFHAALKSNIENINKQLPHTDLCYTLQWYVSLDDFYHSTLVWSLLYLCKHSITDIYTLTDSCVVSIFTIPPFKIMNTYNE